jgi:hypothetical protein
MNRRTHPSTCAKPAAAAAAAAAAAKTTEMKKRTDWQTKGDLRRLRFIDRRRQYGAKNSSVLSVMSPDRVK